MQGVNFSVYREPEGPRGERGGFDNTPARTRVR